MSYPQVMNGQVCPADDASVSGAPWFAVNVKSKSEFRAHDELQLRGFEAFLPLRRVRRRWSDRVKTLEIPIFPGYLFCRFDLPDRYRVLNAPGVHQILGIGSQPVPVSETEISCVQALVASRTALTPWPYLPIGQRVVIDRGPLAGVEGIIIRADDDNPRVVVSVTMLQRSVAAEVERDWVGLASS